MDPSAKIFAMSMTSLNSMFMMYHYNSYANNPVMLRTNKPLIMRDVFLTKCTSMFPNPLSSIYTTSWFDALTSSAMHWLCAMPVVNIIGWRMGLVVYFGSGAMSSFAYLFQHQINPTKRKTKYDCACSSNGALAGLCTLSLLLPKCYIPTSKNVHAAPLALLWWGKCLFDEYYLSRRGEVGQIQVTNSGSIGGIFFGLMFASLFLRTKVDLSAMRAFYRNLGQSR
ncbi:transmembrane protein, putative [Bodo saltans]|uniref:Transmembrane protein, putative n=1 Tax=Bodo saltans TaxID=75058 RepID=A0A0S4INS6_BODSA|nr:transmembrane protein, putative [Bodo saltans]|eukprot:CUE85939.1 transmembrane protein, putative [Bodo saltans]